MIKKIRKSIPYFFPVIAAILILGLIFSRVIELSSPPMEPEISIFASEASDHIGAIAEVCGKVSSVDFIPQIGGVPTFINFEKSYPNQVFTAVIWGEYRHLWQTPPEQAYQNRDLCVIGQIRDHEGTPQIVVERFEQIKVPAQ